MTIPNLMSFIRILLVPVFCVLYFSPGMRHIALMIVIFSGISDVLDGIIARKFNQVSKLGKVLDPIADKLFQLSTALCLCIDGKVGWWLLILMTAKELFMLIGGSIFYHKTHAVIASKWYGKAMSVTFFAAFVLSLLFDFLQFDLKLSFIIVSCVCIAAMAFSVTAAVRYTQTAVQINNEHKQTLKEKSNGF